MNFRSETQKRPRNGVHGPESMWDAPRSAILIGRSQDV